MSSWQQWVAPCWQSVYFYILLANEPLYLKTSQYTPMKVYSESQLQVDETWQRFASLFNNLIYLYWIPPTYLVIARITKLIDLGVLIVLMPVGHKGTGAHYNHCADWNKTNGPLLVQERRTPWSHQHFWNVWMQSTYLAENYKTVHISHWLMARHITPMLPVSML